MITRWGWFWAEGCFPLPVALRSWPGLQPILHICLWTPLLHRSYSSVIFIPLPPQVLSSQMNAWRLNMTIDVTRHRAQPRTAWRRQGEGMDRQEHSREGCAENREEERTTGGRFFCYHGVVYCPFLLHLSSQFLVQFFLILFCFIVFNLCAASFPLPVMPPQAHSFLNWAVFVLCCPREGSPGELSPVLHLF